MRQRSVDIRHAAVVVTALVWSAYGCATANQPTNGGACLPGEQVTCPCSGGETGVQACLDDGSGLTECDCSSGASSSSASSSSGGGAGGQGGAPSSSSTSQSASQSVASSASSSVTSSAAASSSSAATSVVSAASSVASTGAGGALGCGNCALRFAGSDYVTVANAASLTGGGKPLTVEAWAYFDNVNADCMALVRKGTGNATYDYWLHKNLGPADSLFWASNTSFSVIGFNAVTSQNWFHLAGVYDPVAAKAQLYVNGSLFVEQNAPNSPTANIEDMRIGIDWDLGCGMQGVIDEVRISTIVRYAGNFVPQTVFASDADTMALYHFDEGQGMTAHDASGNGNDGAITGAVWTVEHP